MRMNVGSNVKALKSWFSHNDIEVSGRIRISGESEAPTLREEKSPDQSELHSVFLAATLQQRSADVIIAHCGFRLETLGDFEGDDGLVISDFPEMELKKDRVIFRKVPTMVVVRPTLSKAGHQYFSFLTPEGCEVRQTIPRKPNKIGREAGPVSAIITPKYSFRENKFITTNNIGDLMRTSIRKAGLRVRLVRPSLLL